MSLLLALSVIRGDAPFCPLSDNSGQSQISVGDGLSAFDPKRTFSLSGISDLFLYVLAPFDPPPVCPSGPLLNLAVAPFESDPF